MLSTQCYFICTLHDPGNKQETKLKVFQPQCMVYTRAHFTLCNSRCQSKKYSAKYMTVYPQSQVEMTLYYIL